MLKHKLFRAIAFTLIQSAALTLPAHAQSLVVSAGYAPPTVVLAPGAIITIYVTGLNLNGQSFSASSIPLPTSLGGISVNITSSVSPLVPAVPLLSVAGVFGVPQFTAITMEVPFEIYPSIVHQPASGTIAAVQSGITATQVEASFVEANIKVVQQCTTAISLTGSPTSCAPVVQHGDGSVVSSSSPAQPGEHIVLYAFGLGKTLPAVADGSAATAASSTVLSVQASLNFAPNASPLATPSSSVSVQPDYAGLTPGYVGLYQINLALPAAFPTGVAPCDATAGILSNLTIAISAADSFDGGGICVTPTM